MPVVVENRPGGNTIIAAQSVARAAPDGHTLLTVMDGTLAMNPSLYEKLPYDPAKDFALITQAVSVPMVIAIHPGYKAQDLQALIAAAKAKRGSVSSGRASRLAPTSRRWRRSRVRRPLRARSNAWRSRLIRRLRSVNR